MTNKSILIVDDEPDIRELLDLTLIRMGHDTVAAATVDEAVSALSSQSFDLCLTDMRLPDGNGLDLIDHIQEKYSQTPVAMITAHGNMDAAIRALKSGAFDFISKPVDLGHLREIVTQALSLPKAAPIEKMEKRAQEVASTSSKNQSGITLLGESPAMQKLKKTISKLSRSQAPVYIHGESGTGKELVAKLIHFEGARNESPFIPVNCSAIPSELLESEFFGHKKGSFTGANADKDGLFKSANGGTLFLDEVADLPISMQVKLLRAIQEKAIRPVGGNHEEHVDVRILSATHKDLELLVETGQFRQDLFYRLNVIKLDVPPLRDRKEDIPSLTTFVTKKLAERDASLSGLTIDKSAEKALAHYDFPGNVRELENILERAAALCDDDIITDFDLALPEPSLPPMDIPSDNNMATTPLPANTAEGLQDQLAQSERVQIEAALEKTRWNKTEAAKLLGLTFRQLRYRIKKLGIE